MQMADICSLHKGAYRISCQIVNGVTVIGVTGNLVTPVTKGNTNDTSKSYKIYNALLLIIEQCYCRFYSF